MHKLGIPGNAGQNYDGLPAYKVPLISDRFQDRAKFAEMSRGFRASLPSRRNNPQGTDNRRYGSLSSGSDWLGFSAASSHPKPGGL